MQDKRGVCSFMCLNECMCVNVHPFSLCTIVCLSRYIWRLAFMSEAEAASAKLLRRGRTQTGEILKSYLVWGLAVRPRGDGNQGLE